MEVFKSSLRVYDSQEYAILVERTLRKYNKYADESYFHGYRVDVAVKVFWVNDVGEEIWMDTDGLTFSDINVALLIGVKPGATAFENEDVERLLEFAGIKGVNIYLDEIEKVADAVKAALERIAKRCYELRARAGNEGERVERRIVVTELTDIVPEGFEGKPLLYVKLLKAVERYRNKEATDDELYSLLVKLQNSWDEYIPTSKRELYGELTSILTDYEEGRATGDDLFSYLTKVVESWKE